MSVYINPGNKSFRALLDGSYVDKTGLIPLINQTIDTKRRLTCICRPRRFGKSYAAQTLASYYCTGCDSSELFDDLEAAKDSSYREFMNKYNVLYLDITAFLSGLKNLSGLAELITATVINEILRLYDNAVDKDMSLADALERLVEVTGRQFIAIIDEWDSPIRDQDSNEKTQKIYLEFLRSLFKNSGLTNKVFAAAYMTGILPIKKDGSQSAISEFKEYTILNPGVFAPYFGFTEEDVRGLCDRHAVSFEEMKAWYDGYSFRGENDELISIYNPNSVMEAVYRKQFRSYWQMSSSADSLIAYLNMDFDGLGEDVVELLADRPVKVVIDDFRNDLRLVDSRDDVLTLLSHFGYLCYDPDTERVHIPNDEVRQEFGRAVHKVKHKETIARIKECDELFSAVLNLDGKKAAEIIERIHNTEVSPRHYNSEDALRSVIKLAFFTYKDEYSQLEELAGGRGFADIVYLPKKSSDRPILVIELKWEKKVESAIEQIKQRDYPLVLENRKEDILLVGITYNSDPKSGSGSHRCVIERVVE